MPPESPDDQKPTLTKCCVTRCRYERIASTSVSASSSCISGEGELDINSIQENVTSVAEGWSGALMTRLGALALDPEDFATLHDAGLTLTGVPPKLGGVWQGAQQSLER